MEELIRKIRSCKTMPELDNLRLEVVRAITILGQSGYKDIQNVFIKQKNRLKRIPLSER